jgi:hypothetical protein
LFPLASSDEEPHPLPTLDRVFSADPYAKDERDVEKNGERLSGFGTY